MKRSLALIAVVAAFACSPRATEESALRRGDQAFAQGQYDEALAELKRINLNHLFPHQVFLAISHAQLGNRSEAQAAKERVIELQPQFSAVWFMERFQFHDDLKAAFLDADSMRPKRLPPSLIEEMTK